MSSLYPEQRLRVAAYCRVSTDKDDQLNSLAAQRQFFQQYIIEHAGWQLVAVWADEGLSGTSVKHRPQFSEMIRRALEGEIDLIITKEVSRFARNTVDTLQITRQLREKGVGVLFLNDNIDTRDNDGEFRLTIMASVAQEESRKISERTRWGQHQAMKRGVVFGNNSLYGYTVKDGRLTIRPEQAEVVQSVYYRFLVDRKGAYTIARELTEAEIPPPLRSSGSWSSTMILKMLKNEKYCGDLLQKKYRTTDYLTHRKIINDGAEEKILLRDHHDAIISRTQFEAVQAELAKRSKTAADKSKFSAKYWYSGKVRCSACGKSFILKRAKRASGKEYKRFVCRGHLDAAVSCQMRAVHGDVIQVCARRVLQEIVLDREAVITELLDEIRALRQAQAGDSGGMEKLRQAIQRQRDRKDRAQDAFLDGGLSRQDMQRLTARCEDEMMRLQTQLAELENRQSELEWGADRYAGIRALLERELEGGDAVLDEVIREIRVFPGHFIVEVAELPVRFRVRVEGRGTGRNYQAVVTECVPVADAAGTQHLAGGDQLKSKGSSAL
ncbi:MAG: recombinase family protein [Oscillospiraceae bacterium]|nr:recombinase family protein [Oscillospiraceae bacterium]